MKRIAILGSTGSIGTQALDVIRNNRDKFEVVALSCGSNVDLLKEQEEEFRPQAVCIGKAALRECGSAAGGVSPAAKPTRSAP